MKRIAVIAAHPDDEALGCGGTLIKCKELGFEIFLQFMTNGVGARDGISEVDYLNRKQNITRAINLIAPRYVQFLEFPDNKLDSVPLLDIVKQVEHFIDETKPDIILTHFINDLNIDHAITCRAVMTASRPGSSRSVKQILSFEVPSSTEWSIGKEIFQPDSYVDISDFMEKKITYLNCYGDEIRPYPHPRSISNIQALNQIRGAQIAQPYAEAFMTLRRILDVF